MAGTKQVKAPKKKTTRGATKSKSNKTVLTNSLDKKVDILTPFKENSEDKKLKEKKKTNSFGIYKKIAISFIILTIALVGLIFYFSFAKVSIVLIPNQEMVSDSIKFNVFDQSQESLAGSEDVVGVIKQIAVGLEKEYQATGREVLGEEVVGTVTIINNYTKNQPLVATTRLLSPDGKLFRTKNTVNVPAGGEIEVEVYADEPSPEMAIVPTNFTIPGLWAGLQDKIYGQSKDKMVYNEKAKITIQQADIDSAVKNLKADLLEKTKNDIGDAYNNYSQVLYEINNNSITQELDGKVGEEKTSFNLKMSTKVIVIAFNDEKVLDMVGEQLALSLPDDKEIIDLTADGITYDLLSYDIKELTASVKAQAMAKMVLKNDANIIDRANLVGLTRDQLNEYLGNLPEIAGFEVNFFPSFVQAVPNLADRIDIEIKK
jgi:hypothetical protein